MAFATEFHMPGAYHIDHATPSSQPLSATMFRPPMSPSASSSVYNLAKSTGSLYSDVSMANTPGVGAKRKRTRAEVSRGTTPNADWNMNMDGAGDARDGEQPSADVTERRYTLAGQIDTPTGPPLRAENGILEDSVYSDIDYRRALGSKRQHDELESPSLQLSGLRLETPAPVTPHPAGWSTLALSTIGGVVGKVWEFCKTGGFRGFQAGGGERYGLDGISTPTKGGSSQNGRPWCNEHDIPTLEPDDIPPTPLNEHNVPGGFPQSEYVSLHELSTPDSTPRPAVKRRQTSATNGEELRRNWVIVDEPSPSAPATRISTTSVRPGITRSGHHQPRYSTPTTSSSSRRISVPVSRLGATPSAASRPRTSLRISHAGSPALSGREPASYAAPRSPASSSFQQHNPCSPSRIPLPTNPAGGSAPNPFAIPGTTTTTTASRPSSRQSLLPRCASPAPLKGHKRNVSNTSARIKPAVEGIQDSPRLSAEAKQLAAKKMAAERDADAKMEAFNRRLMDMIRQGKEALGTTVEVEMEFGAPTAGWEDDD
ncbi:hypothetical protein CONLIGDRAFT_577953 [Coniochaeta ligniaria NRRL 30616]|uniref:Uncharacterized protein n=1 Tax=Coniochaeta ligniaria NRRL 30616 TaxID=1408157 RepID=A0A1J7JG15_9PEZI|nr:hypothetical protein CONLIGDRAFT_577953 [Coniochaeta ligniaria NRRL 30616]